MGVCHRVNQVQNACAAQLKGSENFLFDCCCKHMSRSETNPEINNSQLWLSFYTIY